MGHSGAVSLTGNVRHLRGIALRHRGRFERDNMKILKSHAFRVALVLSMLASSALVLEAGKRWL